MDAQWLSAAEAALERAYAPYSHFLVGAALVAQDGRIFTGCNVENASFGLTNCAERVALGAAVAAGARDFQAVVIVTETERPVSPCGACRQVLAEFSPQMDVHMATTRGGHRMMPLDELLPESFREIPQ